MTIRKSEEINRAALTTPMKRYEKRILEGVIDDLEQLLFDDEGIDEMIIFMGTNKDKYGFTVKWADDYSECHFSKVTGSETAGLEVFEGDSAVALSRYEEEVLSEIINALEQLLAEWEHIRDLSILIKTDRRALSFTASWDERDASYVLICEDKRMKRGSEEE